MRMSGSECVNEAREWREKRIRARSTWAFEIVWLLSCCALYSVCGQEQTVFVECRQVKPIKTQKRNFNWHLVLNILQYGVNCWIKLNDTVAFFSINCNHVFPETYALFFRLVYYCISCQCIELTTCQWIHHFFSDKSHFYFYSSTSVVCRHEYFYSFPRETFVSLLNPAAKIICLIFKWINQLTIQIKYWCV